MSLDSSWRDQVLDRIADEDVAALALHLANIESPRGGEGACGEAIYEWCVEAGFKTRRVGIFEDRFNVFAEIPGTSGGPSLAFNAHMDTWMHRKDHLIWRDPNRDIYHRGWRDGDRLIGNPVGNDKGPMSAFMVGARAILDAGVPLQGSLYLHMVVGEIGQDPVDEFQGPEYLSKDAGARYLLTHSPRPSYCICAEASAFKRGWVEAGKAFFRVTVYGSEPHYTPFVERPYNPREHPSAIVRALALVEAIEEWALEYERENTYESEGGLVVPRVNIGAIRAGDPTFIIQSPEVCHLYVDVRTVPGQPSEPIQRALTNLVTEVGLEGEVEQFLNRSGHEAQGIEPLLNALDDAHRQVLDEEPGIVASPACSMWRDHNIYNETGVPSLTYGPTGLVGSGRFEMTVGDLGQAARVYALTALGLCGSGPQ
jgi:acetylornithine deacetylase/succinyl-diaminopimelate desuccinylase-like protein